MMAAESLITTYEKEPLQAYYELSIGSKGKMSVIYRTILMAITAILRSITSKGPAFNILVL